ncbi:patatin-like phospholipase family protein [Brevundimonas faecalis]|uniref:NTE family protein n=1 Tax=Brevundimonas faecalis TaxID=947378 RepID=A0ABV2R8C3_9CAUL
MSRRSLLAALVVAGGLVGGLAGCVSGPDLTPINGPLTGEADSSRLEPRDLGLSGEAVALAFSGGGARAAAFSYGALLELRDRRRPDGRRWIDQVAFVTGVSGGALTAAWFGLHGPDGLDGFRPALLDKDWQAAVHDRLLWPANWPRLRDGGLNGRDRIAGWLAREVYGEARMSDLSGPPVILNATELSSGLPFAFAAPWFDALCSDLGGVRLADAAAASAAYPFAVRPVVLETFNRDCARPLPDWTTQAAQARDGSMAARDTARSFQAFRDPQRLRYVHLLDGGVVDNFGLSSLTILQLASGRPYGPLLSAGDAVRLRRLRVIVVNGERITERPWGRTPDGPDGRRIMEAVADHSTDAAKRNAYDVFRERLAEWERRTVAWRCALSAQEAAALGAPPGWDCADLHYSVEAIAFADLPPERAHVLLRIPTRLSLDATQTDLSQQAGRDAVAAVFP